MTDTVPIEAFSSLQFSSFKLDVAVVFKSKSNLDQLEIAHHPPCRPTISYLDQLYRENKGCVPRDARWGADRTVCQLRCYGQLCLLAQGHGHDAHVPSFDHLPDPNHDFQSLLVIACVKDSTVRESAFVVDQNFLTFLGFLAAFAWFEDLFG